MISNVQPANAIRLPLVLLALLMSAAAVSGGLNRGDDMAVMLVRLMAVVCLTVAIARNPQAINIRRVMPLALIVFLAMLMLLQLVPLPPLIWTSLPGRERLAEAASAVGTPQPWMSVSIVPLRTWNSLLSLLVPAAALVMVSWLPRSTWKIQLRVLIAIGIISALLAIIQVSGPPDSIWYLYDVRQKGGAVGLFANRNHQAALLACMFPMLAVLGLKSINGRAQGLAFMLCWLAVAVFLLPLIVITGSRAGLLLSGISLIATLGMIWPSVRRLDIPRWWGIAGAGGAGIVLTLATILLFGRRSLAMQRLNVTDIAEEQRVLVVEPILRLIRENLPIGTGFGTFDPAFRSIEPYSQLYRTYLNHAHSDPLEFVSDGGVPAALILLVFLFWWASRVMVIWKRPRADYAARMACVVTGLLMLASLVDYPLRTPLAAAVFAMLIGWMVKADCVVVDTERRLIRRKVRVAEN